MSDPRYAFKCTIGNLLTDDAAYRAVAFSHDGPIDCGTGVISVIPKAGDTVEIHVRQSRQKHAKGSRLHTQSIHFTLTREAWKYLITKQQ